MAWQDGRRWLGSLHRNDPLGATIKGTIVAVVGMVFLVQGLPLLGLAFLVLGVATLALPMWLVRRDRERLRAWRYRRTQ